MTARRSAASRAVKPTAGSDGEVSVSSYLGRFAPDIARLIREIRKVARAVAPDAIEQAYRGWPLRVRTDQGLIAVAGFRDHVNVEFGKGVVLDDPEGLLEGMGKMLRHVKVRTVADTRSDGLGGSSRRSCAAGRRA